nr:methyl-cpg-binding domain-containing protein 8 [Ipomoea batatas]
MTSATTNPPQLCGSGADAIAHVDLNRLAQAELLALSHCSASAFDARRTQDLVLPQIDRSLFNESAGSKRQTYSRLGRHHHRTHLPGRLPSASRTKPNSSSDPDNHAILHYLKYFFQNPNSDSPPPPPPKQPALAIDQKVVSGLPQTAGLPVHAGDGKRKQGAKADGNGNRRLQENLELELVNKNGVVVDFAALENNGDEVYSEELRRRTVGLESEEEVLGFVRSLEGQWCSRRRKRKYVDASDFGDALPVGWKLLLALRRRDGHVWVYCRRFISPTGQQFLSCKEVAAFLRSHFMSLDANQFMDPRSSSIIQLNGSNSENNVGSFHGDDTGSRDLVVHSSLPSSTTETQGNELCLMGIDNLPDVQVKDLFECYKCNLTFNDKGAYLEHLFSFHQQTTKRIRVGPSVGEGVIIKDGKYECQFCHKVFDERRSYNGHVGVHVRNNSKGSEGLFAVAAVQKSIDTPSQNVLPSTTSKMDALIEIAQNSISETATARPPDISTINPLPGTVNSEEVVTANTDQEMDPRTDPKEVDLVDSKAESNLDCDLNQHDKENMQIEDDGIVKSGETQVIEINLTEAPKDNSEHTEASNIQRDDTAEQDVGLGNRQTEPNNSNAIAETVELTLEKNDFQEGVIDSSMPISEPLNYFSTFAAESNKEQDEFSVLKLGNETGFEELTLDDIEPFKYDFSEGQGSPSLPGVSVGLDNGSGMEETFNSSLGFGSEEAVLGMANAHQLITVCVWCRSEFILEAFESETQSDSIGYMCPECKAKISGHLDSGLSMGSHGF